MIQSRDIIRLIESLDKLKAVIVDLDGTLVDSMPIHKAGYQKIFSVHDWQFDDQIWEQKAAMGGTLWLKEMLINNHVSDPDSLAQKIKAEKTNWFLHNLNKIALVQPVYEAIQWLRENSTYKIVCATTALPEIVTGIMRRFRLLDFFDLILTAKDVPNGHLKPDPLIYLLVLQKLELAPENCFVIEDSVVGCQASLSAGIACYNIMTQQLLRPDKSPTP